MFCVCFVLYLFYQIDFVTWWCADNVLKGVKEGNVISLNFETQETETALNGSKRSKTVISTLSHPKRTMFETVANNSKTHVYNIVVLDGFGCCFVASALFFQERRQTIFKNNFVFQHIWMPDIMIHHIWVSICSDSPELIWLNDCRKFWTPWFSTFNNLSYLTLYQFLHSHCTKIKTVCWKRSTKISFGHQKPLTDTDWME